jgi:hypothetical protein
MKGYHQSEPLGNKSARHDLECYSQNEAEYKILVMAVVNLGFNIRATRFLRLSKPKDNTICNIKISISHKV